MVCSKLDAGQSSDELAVIGLFFSVTTLCFAYVSELTIVVWTTIWRNSDAGKYCAFDHYNYGLVTVWIVMFYLTMILMLAYLIFAAFRLNRKSN